MFESDYFLPVTEVTPDPRLERLAEEIAVQEASAKAIAAIANPRERELVEAIDAALSKALGSETGYIASLGLPITRRLQAALAEYGVTPDYGASIGCPLRHRQ